MIPLDLCFNSRQMHPQKLVQAAVGQPADKHQQSVFNADSILPNVTEAEPQYFSVGCSDHGNCEAQAKQEAAEGKNQHT